MGACANMYVLCVCANIQYVNVSAYVYVSPSCGGRGWGWGVTPYHMGWVGGCKHETQDQTYIYIYTQYMYACMHG